MSRATNAGAQGNAGTFATCRRGGLTHQEIREIEAHRAKDRPTPWQALARRYGRSEADIRALFEPKPSKRAEPSPLTDADHARAQSGWPPRPLSEDDHRILALVESGRLTQAAAAGMMGCHPRSIVRYLQRREDARASA